MQYISNEAAGVGWSFRTRNGANYDVASFAVRYDYLTPRRQQPG